MWQILFKNMLVKEYPTQEQCIIWCYLNGYVYTGRGINTLDERFRIRYGQNVQETSS